MIETLPHPVQQALYQWLNQRYGPCISAKLTAARDEATILTLELLVTSDMMEEMASIISGAARPANRGGSL